MALREILIQITNKRFQLIDNLTRFNFRLLDGLLQGQGGHTGDTTGWNPQAVIGVGAGQTQDALHRVEAVHYLGRVLRVIVLHAATRSKPTNVFEGALIALALSNL